MLNAKDLELLAAKGISEKQIEEQLACFVKGFPFLEITASASVERGIMVIPQEKQATLYRMPGMLIWQRIRRS